MLNISVAGMWHLGSVTAACLASAGHTVIGIDEDPAVVAALAQAQPPVAEAGLAEMTAREIAAGRLSFSTAFEDVSRSDVVWVAYDTPVDENDVADVEFVHSRALRLLDHMKDVTILVVSSQLPVGSVARLERDFAALAGGRHISFACAPENLRLGKAIEVFLRPDRVVVGVRDRVARAALQGVYRPFTDRIEWMSVESAEMTKHAINSFLATSICFINEIASICESTGADAMEVERGLKTDQRIGPGAYLHAGGPIAGGTLARDIAFLRSLGRRGGAPLPLIEGVYASNEHHKTWLQRRMTEALGTLAGRTISMLGLTYKPGTNTLRRSSAVEAARWLSSQGALVQAFDPQIHELPQELESVVSLRSNMAGALSGSEALVVMTPWPEFQSLDPALAPPVVFDAARFLDQALGARPDIRYYSIGRAN
jgi:UDPglucose 6-dehydrogenase